MNRSGFTLTELLIASTIGLIVMLGMAVVLIGSHRAYEATYSHVNADVVTDGYVARRLFDSTIRKSGNAGITVDEDNEWIEVRYYQNDDSTYLDRYAFFSTTGSELRVEYGNISEDSIKTTQDLDTICENVSSCLFKNSGNSAIMILTLDDSETSNTVVSSAYMHN